MSWDRATIAGFGVVVMAGACGFPSTDSTTPRNYLSKLMRYSRLLNATNSISELQEFVEASLLCWEMRVPFGIYNMTNPGAVTTREVADLIKKSRHVRPGI